jgi:hypothetical protein
MVVSKVHLIGRGLVHTGEALAQFHDRDQVGRRWEFVAYPSERLLVVFCGFFLARVCGSKLGILESSLLDDRQRSTCHVLGVVVDGCGLLLHGGMQLSSCVFVVHCHPAMCVPQGQRKVE